MKDQLKIKYILRGLMEKHTIDMESLSKETKVHLSTVKRLLVKEEINHTINNIEPIADYFGVTIDQLLGRTPLEEEPSSKIKYRFVPILKAEQVKPWLQKRLEKETLHHWAKSSLADEKIFAIEGKKFTSNKSFLHETTLIISPSVDPVHGDFILISNPNFKHPQVVDIYIDKNDYFFSTTENPKQLIPLKLPFQYFGVVAEILCHHHIEKKSKTVINQGEVFAPFMIKCK